MDDARMRPLFAAYAEYHAARREARRTAIPATLGAVLASIAAVACHESLAVCVAAASLLLGMLWLYAGARGKLVSARVRLECLMDKARNEAGT